MIPGLAVALCVTACGDDSGTDEAQVPVVEEFEWALPQGFPVPKVPEDNPMSQAKVDLGRHLFYDKRLSGNETFSCASCHLQEMAFTDGKALAEGSTGEVHPRGSMTLVNVAYNNTFTWANNTIPDLEEQAIAPMFGEEPIVELGLKGREAEVEQRLADEPLYPQMFAKAFPGESNPINMVNVRKAISSFQRVLISGNSPFDQFLYGGDVTAMSVEAQRGMRIFLSETVECFHCHGGFNFADSVTHEGKFFDETAFHNNGLYNLDGQGAYPEGNSGLFEVTGLEADMGRFKAPTLRNIEVTAPYMHDGSIATLEEVIDHYAAGGRIIEEGPLAGDGTAHPNKSEFVSGFEVSERDKSDLVSFLKSLTDDDFLTNPAFSNPWTEGPNSIIE